MHDEGEGFVCLSAAEFVSRVRRVASFDLVETARLDSHLVDDLGLDSFQAFELLIIAEGVAQCMVPPEELPHLRYLDDLYSYYLICCERADS